MLQSGFLLLSFCLCLPRSALAAEPPALTIRDTIGIDWRDEPICWELELPGGGWRGGAVRVERDGSAIPAQATVVKRHGDGSARLVEVRFLIDRLPRDGSTALLCRLGEEGPKGTDLSIAREAGALVLSNAYAAVRLPDRSVERSAGGGFSPLLGVRTVSGKWTGPGYYGTGTTRPSGSRTEILEEGPIRLSARVVTTFENGRSHALTVTLLTGSRSIDLDESFDVGPDDRYRFREYGTDRDELGWEWWSWYGDVEGTAEDHPNNWFLPLGSADFRPVAVRYRGENSTDSDKGLFAVHPPSPKLFRDEFTHDQCEPIISGIAAGRGQPKFSEKQVLARIEGERGRGFLVVIFPRKAGEPPPQVTPWLGGKGAQVAWKGEMHQVVLDVLPHQFEGAGIRGEASCLVVKRTGADESTVCLPAGGTVELLGRKLGSPGPAEWAITGGEVNRREAADLLRRQ